MCKSIKRWQQISNNQFCNKCLVYVKVHQLKSPTGNIQSSTGLCTSAQQTAISQLLWGSEELRFNPLSFVLFLFKNKHFIIPFNNSLYDMASRLLPSHSGDQFCRSTLLICPYTVLLILSAVLNNNKTKHTNYNIINVILWLYTELIASHELGTKYFYH